nr:MAG TPA: hypothetical protein [Caudoviricetes sp.]
MSLPYNLKSLIQVTKCIFQSLDLKTPFCKLADKVRP